MDRLSQVGVGIPRCDCGMTAVGCERVGCEQWSSSPLEWTKLIVDAHVKNMCVKTEFFLENSVFQSLSALSFDMSYR